jgi:hypothetical protein
MTHITPLLHDPVVRSVLRAIEQGDVPLNLVELLAPDGRIHPEAAGLLHRLLSLPDSFEQDVLTLGSLLPDHPARHSVLERIGLALHRADDPAEQGYLLACLARLDGHPTTAGLLEDLADQVGSVGRYEVDCPCCGACQPLPKRPGQHPLADVAHATGWWQWTTPIRCLASLKCPTTGATLLD